MRWVEMEGSAYWLTFAGVFLAVAVWESLRPKQELVSPLARRWSRHGILVLVCTALSMVVFRVTPVVVALHVTGSRFGLLNKPWAPILVRCILGILVLDFLRYAVHWSSHALPFLWRVHQVHHSDPDFDLTTGARVHPLEIFVTQGSTLAAIAILAVPPAAVLIFELATCVQSFFSHANVIMPGWIEKPLRWVFVTPDMHRVHHSEEVRDQSANFGDVFPWWDRLFRTYLPEAGAGPRMTVGLKGFQNERSLGLGFMLLLPFLRRPAEIASPEAPAPGPADA